MSTLQEHINDLKKFRDMRDETTFNALVWNMVRGHLDDVIAALEGYCAPTGWEPLMRRIERGIGNDADAVGAYDELFRRLQKESSPSAIGTRTIYSAPKDGDGILAYSPSFYRGKGGWVAAVWINNGWHSNPGGWAFEPTHWMPLPEVPHA